jgi:hypothetical protein
MCEKLQSKTNIGSHVHALTLTFDFTLKTPSFHLDFLTNQMSNEIYKVIYQ